MMMKKQNAILIAAIVMAFSASAANAGAMTGANTLFATENFGPTATAALAVTPGAVTYATSTTGGIAVNAGGSVYYYFRLTGGKFAVAPLAAQFTGTVLAVGGAGNGVVGAPVLSTDRTTVMVPVTFTVSGTIGVGATLVYTPIAGAIDSVNTTLGTAGGVVTAAGTMSILPPVVVAPSTTTAPDTGTAAPADIDAPAASATVASSAKAISAAVSALPAYTNKIDLLANPVASNYTTPGAMALGSVTFTDSVAVEKQVGGAVNYDIAAAIAAGTTVITATPGAGQAFPIGATLFADVTSTACGAPVVGTTTAAVTAATAGTVKSFTIPAASVASGTAINICMSAPSATNVAAPVTATLVGTLTSGIANTDAATTVTGAGYAVDYNGQRVDVRNYVPAAVVGWTQYLRIINTGSVAATVSAQKIDETSGLPVGTAVALNVVPGATAGTFVAGQLAAGAAVSLPATEIEKAIGVQTATARPRIRITAPTNGLDVQNILFTPNGSFTAMHGKE